MQTHPSPSPARPGALRPRPPAPRQTVPGAVRLGLVLVAAALAGCATSRATREKFLERVPPPQPLLNAAAQFGGGILTAQAWLGPSVRLRKPGEHEEEAGAPGPRDRLRGRNEERDDFSRYTDPFEEDSGDENKYSQEEIDEMYGRVNYQYVLPPRLALTLTFANTGTQRMTVTVTEISSTLGNFAPRPEQLLLGPGQEGALDPMLSNLEDNFNELDVTVGVRIGDRRETQVLKLRHATGPRPGAPAGPPPPAPAK
ncbi:MAG TPA: hypothetical protein VMD31_07720 [Opitutaceae bacterium]|nr:hypothetical protein [Opitutaceae bacterium]